MTDLDRLPAPRQRRRDDVAAAVTAGLVLVIAVAYFVARGGSEPGRPAATQASAGVHPCAAGDLVAGGASRQVTAGTTYLTATLELAPGVEPCTVDGFPFVVVLADWRPAGVATVTDGSLGDARQLTVLPDRSVKVTFGWAASHACGPVDDDAVRLRVAPGLAVEVPGFGRSACSAGETPPAVRVGPFTYVDPNTERGSVTGVVTLNGGPALGTGQFVTSGEVEFAGEPDGHRAAIGADGSYRITLPTGRYQVTVSTHQWNGGVPYAAGTFDVVGGELNDLNLTLPVR
ncbi:hypothetical protein D0Z08_24215 [Nocardioides immobilis]|uniref:DUF4232 domain-containing protein n=1 Tax=Nocardioides immobilis TaxID=2049295 RepID=A0A417XVB0_9ACTN|nr:hypothetical protein [Nocardioides immobilis]RHW24428.1 hypothetical protein D0Z08_24215 [Nocardioides immobilis]